MAVQFAGIPSTLRAPSTLAEFDSARAAKGAAALVYRGLIVGQKLKHAGLAAANSLHKVRNADEVAVLAGRGSMLHRQAIAFFYSNKSTECYIGVLDDSGSAVAVGQLDLTGTSTEAGAFSLYIGGNLVRISVASGATAVAVLAALALEIGTRGHGTVTMATAIATNTVTVGGVAFVGAAGAVVPGAATFSVDTSNALAAASLAAQINAHATASRLVFAYVVGSVVHLFATNPDPAVGNAITLASSGSTVAVSGATLSGGAVGTNRDLPAYAYANGTGGLMLFATNAGAVGNEIDLRVNYRPDSEATPAGLTLVITDMSGGAVNPVLTTLIAALGDTWFNIVANPYTDATSLTALEAEGTSRFAPLRHLDVQIYSAKDASYGTLGTLGASRNSPFNSIIRTNESPRWSPEVAANVMAVASLSLQNDPAQPLGTLALDYVEAPADSDLDTYEERDLLLKTGISTLRVAAGGLVQIDKLITTYRLNAAGSPDTAYYNLETMATLAFLRFSWVAWWAARHSRSKLADDGAEFGSGQKVVTPKTAKAEAMAWFRAMEDLVLVEDGAQFKADLVAERNVTNRSRLDMILAPKLVGQLDIAATKISFLQ